LLIGEMVQRVSPAKGSRVLDIGYFTGFSTAWLMIATEAELIYAIDVKKEYAPSMKDLLRTVNPDAKVVATQASASWLPYQDNVFDTVFCRSVLQYVDMQKTIAEIRRVLKPQGKCYIIANMADNLFVRLYRKFVGSKRFIPFGSFHGYVSYRMLNKWMREGWCVSHKEFHVFTPLLFPIIDCLPLSSAKRAIYIIGTIADAFLGAAFPFLYRFAWLGFIEIRK
jgi:ubiquinone/menaquinone biosynthesis C-methylase UbiE